MADTFHVEWIFLTCLCLFQDVFEHTHCFFGYTAFCDFSPVWGHKWRQKFIAHTWKDARWKKLSCNTLRVDVTLAVRELPQKSCSNVNIPAAAVPKGWNECMREASTTVIALTEICCLLLLCRSVTSLGHQGGRRVFWEGTKFFKLCPIHFSMASEKFCKGSFAPPGYRPAVM